MVTVELKWRQFDHLPENWPSFLVGFRWPRKLLAQSEGYLKRIILSSALGPPENSHARSFLAPYRPYWLAWPKRNWRNTQDNFNCTHWPFWLSYYQPMVILPHLQESLKFSGISSIYLSRFIYLFIYNVFFIFLFCFVYLLTCLFLHVC